MPKMLNRARMTTTTTGTGTVTLGSSSLGYATFAEAGAVDGASYAYCIEDGNDFEIGVGTYASSGTTFSRDAVTLSKISGTPGTSKINLSGSAQIFITARVEDLTPAYALISRQVASNSAALSWTGLDTTNYDSFELVFSNLLPATDSVSLYVQVGTGATPTWQTSGYLNISSAMSIAASVRNSSNYGISGSCKIGNLASAKTKQSYAQYVHYDSDNLVAVGGTSYHMYNSTTAVTALRILFSSGNISSGIASLYGRRNS